MSKPFKIWAVINLTPDSFYANSRVSSGEFIKRCVESLSNGADILDIGAESTRPFSQPVSADEEWLRLETPLNDLKKEIGDNEFSKRISIDTYKHETAQKVLALGAGIINDITGGESIELLKTVANYNANIVLMHLKGRPENMQMSPEYNNVVSESLEFLRVRSRLAIECGIPREKIIWDFGIGFGKSLNHNLELLNNTSKFQADGYPLLVGISRKSFIDKMLNIPDAEMRRDPSMIIHTYLALRQVDILRVHDVAETNMIREIMRHLH